MATERTGKSIVGNFLYFNRRSLSTLGFFTVMMIVFIAANPTVFLQSVIYKSVFITLPIVIFLVVPAVFVVTAGEIDLSFPSVMGMSAWFFALATQAGLDPFISILIAILGGTGLGLIVGALVVYAQLSSLVASLGMNFLLRGLIFIFTEGRSIPLPELSDSFAREVLAGRVFDVPVQIFWAILFVIICAFLFNRHRFGAHVHHVGDNPQSAVQMGIPVDRVRMAVFGFIGFGAALAGVCSVMVNFVWWPTTGEGFLLLVLAALFVGGTPTWGGVGTIIGGAIGALIVTFMDTGVVAAGLSGFYVQFFEGLIIILALIGHRFHGRRVR